MNYIRPDIVADVVSEVAPPSFSTPQSVGRKWPIRYESIEFFAICTDVATILLASILSALLYRIHSTWTAADLGKAVGSAIIVSALFVSLLKARGMYRPTELLVLRNQVRAVCLAWAFVFFLLAGAVGALNIGHELSRGAGLMFALLGLATLIAHRANIRALLMKGLSRRKFAGGNVVLITDQPQSHDAGLARTLTMLGFCVTGHFRLPPPGSGHRKRLSARVIEHIRGSDIEEVIVEADPNRWSELRAFVAELRVLPFPIVFVPVGAVSEMIQTTHSTSRECYMRRTPTQTSHRIWSTPPSDLLI